MRRTILAFLTLLLLAFPAMAQKRMMLEDDFMWEGGGRYYGRDPMPQLVQQSLSMQREAGMDNWSWRDAVETRLVSLGPAAIGYMQSELENRDGFEADAIQVALFRLANAPLTPKETLQEWGRKHFSLTPDNLASLKINRVMDSRDGAGLMELFPHHLFYVLEFNRHRVLVALASDAKVQPLEDDVALAHFIKTEAAPQLSSNDKTHLASAVALLMLAREVTPYRPEFHQGLDTDLKTYRFTLQFEGFKETAALTFTPDGVLATLTSGQTKSEVKPAAPMAAPTSTAPPPMMPE